MSVLSLTTEQALWEKGISFVVGTDEVGRGALAGPVAAAAVVLPINLERETWWYEVKDSKALSHKKRVELARVIEKQALAYAVHFVEPAVIDDINILQASLLAMRLATEEVLQTLGANVAGKSYLLVDGNIMVPNLAVPQSTVVAGDASVVSIAAASILAKVARDQLMAELDMVHPGYGFAQHKGYGTKVHFAALRQLGLSPVHRRSFCGTIPTLS